MMIKPHRHHPLWLAFVVHRLSGVCLALYLPVHFLVLGLAIDETARLDGLLQWSEALPVKVAEMGLVFLLAVHLFGGLRLLALEFLPWHDRQKTVAAVAVALSFSIATAFFMQAG